MYEFMKNILSKTKMEGGEKIKVGKATEGNYVHRNNSGTKDEDRPRPALPKKLTLIQEARQRGTAIMRDKMNEMK